MLEFNSAAEQLFGYAATKAVGTELAELIVFSVPARAPPARAAADGRDRRVDPARPARRAYRHAPTAASSRSSWRSAASPAVTCPCSPARSGTSPSAGAETELQKELLRLEQLARLDATEARDQLEAILSGIADAVIMQAPDGHLLFANQAAVSVWLRVERAAAVGSSRDPRALRRARRVGNPFPVEQLPGGRLAAGERSEVVVRFRVRETGEERWSAVKATPIRDHDGRVAMAINVIEDITSHKRAERAQRFLSESTAVLSSSLDPEQVLGQVAALAVPAMADWLFIDLVGELGVERVAVQHSDPELVARAEALHRSSPLRPPGAGRRAQRAAHRALRVPLRPAGRAGGGRRPRHLPLRLAREFRMRSAIVVPMIARGRTLGALTLASDGDGRRFDQSDLELAEELARRCAIAIDNARLFSTTVLHRSTSEQSLLLSELPDIPASRPPRAFGPSARATRWAATSTTFETGERGWTIAMGTCGKGPDAAAAWRWPATRCGAAAMRDCLPSRSLRVLNEALLRQREDRRFCTVAYAYLETVNGGARVGALPAAVIRCLCTCARTAGWEPAGALGSLLGVLPDPRFEDHSMSPPSATRSCSTPTG